MYIPLKDNAIKSSVSIFILFSIVGVIVYFNSLDNGFHLDDHHHIVNNIFIRSIENIPLFFVDERTFSAFGENAHYRPLLLASHSINYYFSRLNPAGYHLVNIAFHVGTAFLVYLIVQSMLCSTFVAIASGLIFLTHPFNSEAVNYISARSSIMGSFFYLMAFYFWIKYRRPADQNSSLYYIAALIAAFLGMLSKEIIITFPLILLLYDLYFPTTSLKGIKANLKNYIPFIVLVTAPVALLRLYFVGNVVDSEGTSYFLHLLMEAKVLTKFIYLFFFPVNLSIEHAILEVHTIVDWKVLGSVLIILVLIGLILYLAKSNKEEWRVISFFICWFFITLLPTTLIPLNAPLQENRGYLAIVGFAAFLGISINRFAAQRNYKTVLKNTAFILLLILYSILTYDRNTLWKDEITLWLDAVEKSPTAWRAHLSLARSLEVSGLEDLAIHEYRKAAEIKPDLHLAMNNIGDIYLRKENLDSALISYKQAVSMKPTDFNSRINLAWVYFKVNRGDLARKECEKILKLGELLKEDNEYTAAARDCIESVKLKEMDRK